MIIGYTLLDPLVVLVGTLLAGWYLQTNAMKLIGLLPTALSLWFFAPFVTNVTLWQTVPLLLTGRGLLKSRANLPRQFQVFALLLALSLAGSAAYALIAGGDTTRVVIRLVYYLGAFFVLSFSYEMGRRPEAYETLLNGLVVMGLVYAVYGAYQIVAFYTGLPMRGIVYSASGGSIMAFEGGILRINSLANEPKRLGYVLFLAAMACIFLAKLKEPRRARRLLWHSGFIFAMSLMTYSGSYFVAIVLFGVGFLVLYPSRATLYFVLAAIVSAGIIVFFPDLGVLEAIQIGLDRRSNELEVGLDGGVVYRQEIFAWDYLSNFPSRFFTGVGLGQYYAVLNGVYGEGAGYNAYGGLMPLNSNFIELIFDIGLVGTAVIYGGLTVLVIKLRFAGETFFSLALLFLVMQSFSLLTLLYIALFAGVAMGRLAARRSVNAAAAAEPVP